jgi:hypothetical protein
LTTLVSPSEIRLVSSWTARGEVTPGPTDQPIGERGTKRGRRSGWSPPVQGAEAACRPTLGDPCPFTRALERLRPRGFLSVPARGLPIQALEKEASALEREESCGRGASARFPSKTAVLWAAPACARLRTPIASRRPAGSGIECSLALFRTPQESALNQSQIPHPRSQTPRFAGGGAREIGRWEVAVGVWDLGFGIY